MRILIPVLGFGRQGGYRVLSELANQWVSEGHGVDFLVNHSAQPPYFPTVARIHWISNIGTQSRVAEGRRERPTASTLTNLISLYLGIGRLANDYDVVLANHSLTAWPIALASGKRPKRFYYVQAYEPDFYASRKDFNAKVLTWLSKKSYELDLIRVCNSPVYLNYQNIRARNWIAPGIDLGIFHEGARSVLKRRGEAIILGCIGRHEPYKGTQYVLDAFEKLHRVDRRFRLRVAYGNLPPQWRHSAVEVIIPKNDAELANYYRSLDIMIAATTIQLGAFHYPVLEALACGIPVVSTGHSPASEHNAWIVPIENSVSIVETVRAIVANEDLALAKCQKGLQEVRRFAWPRVSQEFIEVFTASLAS